MLLCSPQNFRKWRKYSTHKKHTSREPDGYGTVKNKIGNEFLDCNRGDPNRNRDQYTEKNKNHHYLENLIFHQEIKFANNCKCQIPKANAGSRVHEYNFSLLNSYHRRGSMGSNEQGLLFTAIQRSDIQFPSWGNTVPKKYYKSIVLARMLRET